MDKSKSPESKSLVKLNPDLIKSSKHANTDKYLNIQRYTKLALEKLRNESSSKKRPDCASRPELQYLGVWKFNNNNVQLNTNSGDNGFQTNSYLQTRNQRSPITRSSNLNSELSPLTLSSSNSQSSSIHQNLQKVYIDHRSISSSHLMPAFAKKKIVETNQSQSTTLIGGNPSHNNDIVKELRPEALHNVDSQVPHQIRHRSRDHFEHKSRTEHLTNILSPHRKIGDRERDRLERTHEHDNSGSASSLTSVINPRQGNAIYERRIGSGRVLPRDMNWDYNGQDREKTSCNFSLEKESSENGTHFQQRNTGRGIDRSDERNNTILRRSFDRRNFVSNKQNENAYEKTENVHGGIKNSRRFITSEASHRADMTYNSQISANPRNRRINHNNDHTEEPEWFSSGPTSQNDTIELRGFEESDENNSTEINSKEKTYSIDLSKKSSESSPSGSSSNLNFDIKANNISSSENLKESDTQINKSIDELNVNANNNRENHNSFEGVIKKKVNSNSTNEDNKSNNNEKNVKYDFSDNKEKSAHDIKESEFNFDAFLNMDPFDHTLMRGKSEVDIDRGSRFSRWFGNCSNENEEKGTNQFPTENRTNTLMEFLKQGLLPAPQVLEGSIPSDIPSVEELEARMRKIETQDNALNVIENTENNEKHKNTRQEYDNGELMDEPIKEAEAFKKVLEQLNLSSNNSQSQQLNFVRYPNRLPVSTINMHSLNLNNQYAKQPGGKLLHQMLPVQIIQQTLQSPKINKEANSHMFSQFEGQSQKKMECLHLYHCVLRGEISPNILEQDLSNQNISDTTKEIISAVLKEFNFSNSNPMPNNLQLSEPPLNTSVFTQPDLKIFNSGNENSQQNITQKVPDPVHQTNQDKPVIRIQKDAELINKNLLLKNKIDNQHYQSDIRISGEENPQQDVHVINQQEISISGSSFGGIYHQQNFPSQSAQQHTNSPTPLAFTPTSVLRKMTAEKDNTCTQQQINSAYQDILQQSQLQCKSQANFLVNQHQQKQQLLTQPRMILGGNTLHQASGNSQISPQAVQMNQIPSQTMHNPLHSKWPTHMVSPNLPCNNRPLGRPILKGPIPILPIHSQQQNQQHHSQHQQTQQSQQQQQQLLLQNSQLPFGQKIDQYQNLQHRFKNNHNLHVVNHPQPVHAFQNSIQQQHPRNVIQTQNNIMTHMQQQQQILQQRAISVQRQQQQQLHQHFNQQQLEQPNRSMIIQSCNDAGTKQSNTPIINFQRDGGLSPTSNQLAQWFSPELLAQASAGKLPLLNMNQAVSLEEFEKNMQHSSAKVHN